MNIPDTIEALRRGTRETVLNWAHPGDYALLHDLANALERSKTVWKWGKQVLLLELAEKPRPTPEMIWAGCGECDVSFPCHNGQQRCIRLPAQVATDAAPRITDSGALHVDADSVLASENGQRQLRALRDLPIGNLRVATDAEPRPQGANWPLCSQSAVMDWIARTFYLRIVVELVVVAVLSFWLFVV